MAFDCYCINFQNKKSKENINKIKQVFPYVKVMPFIRSYYDLSKVVIESANTEYVWMLSSKIDYTKFDFNYIPEQFEAKQLHTWSCLTQKEGDTFLFHKSFTTQNIKFLRDFEYGNYHTENLKYDNDTEAVEFNLSNVIESLPSNANKYIFAGEDFIGAKIASISTSPKREDTILIEDPFKN